MKCKNEPTELIVHQAMEESPGELSSKNPMVLSCGGIYIPHDKRRRPAHPLWHILNLADEKRPTKVIGSNIYRSPLVDILKKEGMN